jgi:hypothetical protein
VQARRSSGPMRRRSSAHDDHIGLKSMVGIVSELPRRNRMPRPASTSSPGPVVTIPPLFAVHAPTSARRREQGSCRNQPPLIGRATAHQQLGYLVILLERDLTLGGRSSCSSVASAFSDSMQHITLADLTPLRPVTDTVRVKGWLRAARPVSRPCCRSLFRNLYAPRSSVACFGYSNSHSTVGRGLG